MGAITTRSPGRQDTLSGAGQRAAYVHRNGMTMPQHAGASLRGAAWYLLRRCTPGERTEIDDVVWGEGERLSFRRSLGTSRHGRLMSGPARDYPGGPGPPA